MPDSFPALGAQDIRSYILPTVILGLLSVSGIVIWLRRYMIDQQSSDYVKFAKAKGLNAKKKLLENTFSKCSYPNRQWDSRKYHRSDCWGDDHRNKVFAAPGMGKMLPDAVIPITIHWSYRNRFVFTTVSVIFNLSRGILRWH